MRPVPLVAAGFLLAVWALPAAATQCERRCETWAYGYKEPAPDTYRTIRNVKILQTIAGDPTFNRGDLLRHVALAFRGGRLLIGPSDRPEYSLTATFSKATDLNTGQPMSCLAVALAFTGGDRRDGSGSLTWVYKAMDDGSGRPDYQLSHNEYPAHYHGVLLHMWVTLAPGHDLAAHVPKMAAQVSLPQIEALMTAYEQLPVSLDVDQDNPPSWCEHPRDDSPMTIRVGGFRTAADPPNLSRAHDVRFIVRASRGRILNGDAVNGDPKARVFIVPAASIRGHTDRLDYQPPEGADRSDTVTISNACEIRPTSLAPAAETTPNTPLLEIENQCGWQGTLSKRTSMKAGEGGSGLAELAPGMQYDLSTNWTLGLQFKRSSRSGNVVRYELGEARLNAFDDETDATLFKMRREGREISAKTRERAEVRPRRLSRGEADLTLAVDTAAGTYSLEGEIDIRNIPVRGQDDMKIRAAPVNADIREDAETTSVSDEVDVSGTFRAASPPQVPEQLKGSRDLIAEVPDEFRKFLETLGGKQSAVLRWEFQRKPIRVTKF